RCFLAQLTNSGFRHAPEHITGQNFRISSEKSGFGVFLGKLQEKSKKKPRPQISTTGGLQSFQKQPTSNLQRPRRSQLRSRPPTNPDSRGDHFEGVRLRTPPMALNTCSGPMSSTPHPFFSLRAVTFLSM